MLTRRHLVSFSILDNFWIKSFLVVLFGDKGQEANQRQFVLKGPETGAEKNEAKPNPPPKSGEVLNRTETYSVSQTPQTLMILRKKLPKKLLCAVVLTTTATTGLSFVFSLFVVSFHLSDF